MLELQCLVLLLAASLAQAEILTPPYFNLAEGREITASATCGVDTPGKELYCKLVGANADQDEDINLIQGQVRSTEKFIDFFIQVYIIVCSSIFQFTFSFIQSESVATLFLYFKQILITNLQLHF